MAAGIFAAILILYSWQAMVADMRFGVTVAAGIKAELRTSNDIIISRPTDGELKEIARSTCRSELLRPALSLHLFRLGRVDRGNAFQEWAMLTDTTLVFLRHMASCMPAEANVYTRTALVTRVVVEDRDKLSRLLAASHRLAPNEKGQILARLQVYRRLSDDALRLQQADFQKDLEKILARGEKNTVFQVRPLRQGLYSTIYMDIRAAQPKDRRRYLNLYKL